MSCPSDFSARALPHLVVPVGHRAWHWYPAAIGNRRAVLAGVLYGGLAILLAGALLEVWSELLPRSVADRVDHNSEAYLLALILGAWIQFGRDRLAGTPRERPVTLAVAVASVGAGLLLLTTDLPSRFRTLNETFLAVAVLIPYLQIRRPLPPRVAAGLAGGLFAFVVLANRTAFVTELAETLAALMVAPVAFDLVDRGILDRRARTSPPVRYTWYASMVAVPVFFSFLQYGLDLDGTGGEVTRFGVRVAEVFICMLALELYFAVGLGRTGTPTRTPTRMPTLARAGHR